MQHNQQNILQLPQKSLLERRLTKAFFQRNFSLSASEKKTLNAIVMGMQWLASLKPSTTNIPAVKNEQYSYDEIQIFIVQIGESDFEKHYKAVAQLIHKYIPYQIFLIIEGENSLAYVGCDKRINQADASKRTIEAYHYTPIINTLYQRAVEKAFNQALDFAVLNKRNLQTTYQSYIQAIVEYTAACMTGVYQKRSKERTAEDLETLQTIEQLQAEISSLENQIQKETQFNRKTKLNIDLQKKRSTIEALQRKLNQI